jgi:ABC-type branched-subunit amino acid transport system substrate-binding protein
VRRPALLAAAMLAASVATASVAVAQTTTTTAPVTTAPATTVPATTTLPTTALTRSTISVGGVVDPAYAGAEVGAQARIARANARGGVAGRRIVYIGTALDAKSAISGIVPISAVVPAASPTLDTVALAAAKVPFFGPADTAVWTGNASGFGFAGAQVPGLSRTASPAWGMTLKALLGGAKGKTIAVGAGPDHAAEGEQARASLRAAGFTVPAVITVSPSPELSTIAPALTRAGPDGVVLLTDAATAGVLASTLAAQSYTGTVATTQDFYRPEIPAVASGLTVLLPYAPPEQVTAANKALLADVERFAPGTKVTAGVIKGYWAADAFVAALTKAGRGASAAKLAKTLRSFTYEVKGTVGPSTFPTAHSQPSPCGALVQSDGTVYLPAVTYRCGTPVKVKPSGVGTAATTTTTVKK